MNRAEGLFQRRRISDEANVRMANMRLGGMQLVRLMDSVCPIGLELETAVSKVREAVMWAQDAIQKVGVPDAGESDEDDRG